MQGRRIPRSITCGPFMWQRALGGSTEGGGFGDWRKEALGGECLNGVKWRCEREGWLRFFCFLPFAEFLTRLKKGNI